MTKYSTVYELLEDPNHWTQGTYARNKYGDQAISYSDEATCFCLLGAIYRVYAGSPDKVNNAIGRLSEEFVKMGLPQDCGNWVTWQDERETTHEEVLELVKRAGI